MKVRRAEQFIQEVQADLDAYRENEPFYVGGVNTDVFPPTVRIEWKGIGLEPGAIAGDAIHNLRTALDLMASELARLNARSDKDVYFPFSDGPDTFDEAVKRRCFHKTGDDAVALLRQFAPYRGGNEMLRTLHDLDIHDKHTALVPSGALSRVHFQGLYDIDDPKAGNFAVTADDIHYIFPENGPFGGRRMIETLKELVELVNGILETFAAMVEART
jgi:hypothetical protein